MKRILTLMLGIVFSVTLALAKDIKTFVVTTNPQMHCENCEKKIKNGLRFIKGVKEITTNVKTQTVAVKYDADKTSEQALIDAFQKIGYTVTPKKCSKAEAASCKQPCGKKCSKDKKCCKNKKGGCKDKKDSCKKN